MDKDVLTFAVHSCARGDVPVDAVVNGDAVVGYTPGLVVELICGQMTMTLRTVPTDVIAAEAFYAVGNLITATLTSAPPA